MRSFNLLTSKPILYLANVAESDLPEGDNAYVRALRTAVEESGEVADVIPVSSRIESELAELGEEERAEFLTSLGLEEPGLQVEVGPVIEVFDRITRDEEQRVRYHYVLVDYLCWPIAGELQAGSDVDDAVLVDPEGMARFELTPKTTAVIERAVRLAREAPRPVR